MKLILKTLIVVTTIFYGMLVYGKASTDLSALDDGTRALITKEKMRTQGKNADKSQAEEDKDPTSFGKNKRTTFIDGGVTSGCDINIGNSKQRPGTNSQPTTVIITGPVIQMPGKACK